MRKRSIWMAICALFSALSISFVAGCGGAGDASVNDSTVGTGGSESVGGSSDSTDGVGDSSDSTGPSAGEETPDDIPNEDALSLIAPEGEVFPYIDEVKNYLQAGEGAKVGDYYRTVTTQATGVQIKWKYSAEGARKFLVEYATKADYSDAISVEAGASKRSVEVKNLYKATKYYVRVSALDKNGAVKHSAEGTFETTSLGPRFMYVDDVRNMRDLGGYETVSGKTLVQGIAYRSGALTPPPGSAHYSNELSAEGKAYMSEVLGIKTEIDFRSESESGVLLADGSVIPGATLKYITLNGYGDTFQYAKQYREFFSTLANPSNYPVIMHCTGGADRTGSVVYLLHTMLGVSELECLQGYELTSFSTYGVRDTQDGSTYENYFTGFMQKLNTYAGATSQEKAETWMREIGITQAQIDSIKAIFYGEMEIGVSGEKSADKAPILRATEKKTLSETFSETMEGWTLQKKEN